MGLLEDKDREFLQKEFASLTAPVKLVVFTQEFECQFCRETREIAEEVAGLSDKVGVEVYDFVGDQEQAEKYGIDKIPATAVLSDDKDYGIRYYGIPSGYEFSSLIEDIMMVSQGQSGLSEASRQAIAGIEVPVHMQVFVTPTCPYCPRAVHLAHQFALESEHIRADMVEAMEFPHLANKYQIMGVPRTVINEDTHLEGAAPEPMLLAKLMEAVKKS
jgi:glutaredoxin-like protein